MAEPQDKGASASRPGSREPSPSVSALTGFDPSRVRLDWIGGNCPVQAEGLVDGKPFYFRARGDGWEFWVGEPWTAEAFTIGGPYGKWPDAGWMPTEAAVGFIVAGIHAYWHLDRDSDGSPKGGDACGSVEDDSAAPKGIAR